MPLRDSLSDDATMEECLEELNDRVSTLDRYSPIMLAVAMRVHLASLLSALLELDLCTRQEIREFIQELKRDALESTDD